MNTYTHTHWHTASHWPCTVCLDQWDSKIKTLHLEKWSQLKAAGAPSNALHSQQWNTMRNMSALVHALIHSPSDRFLLAGIAFLFHKLQRQSYFPCEHTLIKPPLEINIYILITFCSPESPSVKQSLLISACHSVNKLLLCVQHLLRVWSQHWDNDSLIPSVVEVQWLAVTAVILQLCANILRLSPHLLNFKSQRQVNTQ